VTTGTRREWATCTIGDAPGLRYWSPRGGVLRRNVQNVQVPAGEGEGDEDLHDSGGAVVAEPVRLVLAVALHRRPEARLQIGHAVPLRAPADGARFVVELGPHRRGLGQRPYRACAGALGPH
jgi:hypothetical protein